MRRLSSMRALVVDREAPGRLRLTTVPDPVPGPGEVLVRVHATSLNYGEIPTDLNTAPEAVPGWDAAGVVERAAPSGGGPAPGARVVTWGRSGGWAELRTARVDDLAVLPSGVSFAQAAAVPVAGLTALRSLRQAGVVPRQRVAITGASGGVGHFAVQLARRLGAEVYALVGNPARGAGLAELGAHHVLVGPKELDAPLDVVLDNVGGPQLAEILGHMAQGGTVVSIGATSWQDTPLAPYQLVKGQLRLIGFQPGDGFAADLSHLVGLVAAGQLDPGVGSVTSWHEAGSVIDDLLARRRSAPPWATSGSP
ncbi:zinc-binding dehydrogenase [Streptomyces sp. NPDC002454]